MRLILQGAWLGLVSSLVLANDIMPPLPPIPPALDKAYTAPKKRQTVTLPMVGMPAQGATQTKQNVVRISDGANEIVYVALGFPNRIATPFDNPQVIWGADVEFKIVGRDIYLMPDRDIPIGAFITDQSGSTPASLTLIPRPGMPGQNILLAIEGGAASPSGLGTSVAREAAAPPPSDYVDGMKQILRSFVQNGSATGFQEGNLRIGAARVGGVLVTPEKLWTGSSFNVYRYRVENVGVEPIELNEPSFHEEGVRAVSFWPNARLAPREATQVFIVADIPKAER